MWQTNNFGDRFFGLGEGTETSWVCIRVDLFDKLECDEIEDEGFFIQDDNHHVFSKLDVHDELISIECNFGSILLLVIVPNEIGRAHV